MPKRAFYFIILCLAAAFVAVYFVIKPFIGPLILASVFAFLFQPLYSKILPKVRKKQGLAALATMVITIVLVLFPIIFLGSQIFNESSQLYNNLANDKVGFIEKVEDFANGIGKSSFIPGDFSMDLNQYSRQILSFVTQSVGGIFSSIAKGFLNFFVFMMAYYYFLKDGYKLKDYLVKLSPLDDKDDEFVVKRIESAVSAVVKGNLLIGLIQGTLTGIGFALFGVPNPVLWGGVAAITALVPGVGTAIIITPAIIFLFFLGNTFGAVGLLIWGITAVGLVDNFLGPKLVGSGMKLHPLAAFLAVLGGLALFGPLGLLLGPLTLGICLAFIEIYFSLTKREESN